MTTGNFYSVDGRYHAKQLDIAGITFVSSDGEPTVELLAPKGALCVDRTTPALYQNTGTEDDPVWTKFGE